MSDPVSGGMLSTLAPIMQGATKTSTDPGQLRQALCGRAIARAATAGHWTVEQMWSVAEHLGISRTDLRTGAGWTQADLAVVRRRLGITQKLSDTRETVNA